MEASGGRVLCSYSTLPLCAAVTQMGDLFKEVIFAAQLRLTLHGWAEDARKRKRSDGIPLILKIFSPKNKKQESPGTGVEVLIEGLLASQMENSELEAVQRCGTDLEEGL
ncbi:MLO protein homolog 1-like [Typha latifolia]|uniref:MLO protein homolog 1-like n=1 Tax=Typha latifolia TaxID=4733 RepID=UPI003C2AAE4E